MVGDNTDHRVNVKLHVASGMPHIVRLNAIFKIPSMEQRYSMDWLLQSFEHGDPLKFIYFWGHTRASEEEVDKSCFSQWYPAPFEVNGHMFKTAEHWMMAQKARLFGDEAVFHKILSCEKPGEAKELGRQVLHYDEDTWKEHRYDIVRAGNIHKFNQHPELASYLLATDKRVLVEASPVDAIWGIGLSKDSAQIDNLYAWRGLNLLGFALMEARDFLKSFGLFKPLDKVIAPPWDAYPGKDPYDMFWQMGDGDEYMMNFSRFYNALSSRDKTIYAMTYRAPVAWMSFYEE